MSTTPSHPTPPEFSQPNEGKLVALTPTGGLGKLQVELESFVAFNIWMTRELGILEDRFADFQTSSSTSRRKNSRS